VIGSGFGGLAAAIRLQAAGIETTLFEARDKPGGRAYVYHDAGFTFDAGPTVITAPHCFEELYALAGRQLEQAVELVRVRPFYRLMWNDGETFDYDGDADALLKEVRRIAPGDEAGYLRFAEHSRRLFEAGYTGAVSEPFLRLSDMVRLAPKLAGLRADRSVYGTVRRFVRSQRLREALSFHSLLVGGNPFETSAVYSMIHHLERRWGVWFPRGGTGALVRALVDLFTDLGGELRLSTPVRRVRVRRAAGRPVHFVDTEARAGEPFDAVVSNADVHHTYGALYGDDRRARRTRRRLERMSWSMSLFVLYFGTDVPYDRDVVHHSVLFGPRFKGHLDEIFHGSRNGPGIPDDLSLYLHAPTVTDPSLAPPGCGAFYVLSPVPHLGHAPLDWDRIAPEYADKILASLESLLPNLRQHVVTRRWITPRTFQTELASYLGSAFSCAPILGQSAYFRPHNRDPRVPGLYLVGAGTHPGAGVPGVVNSAKVTARLVREDLAV
jgi:phytoene desaturase